MKRRKKKDIMQSVIDGDIKFEDLDDESKEAVWKYIRWRMKGIQIHYFFRVMKDFFIIVGIIIAVLLSFETKKSGNTNP